MLKVRQPEGSDPKYKSVGPLPVGALYVAGTFRDGPLIIVEGELDALLLAQELGRMATVVTLGAAATMPDEAVLLRLAGCGALFAAHDADAAGDEAAAWWTGAFPRCTQGCAAGG